VCNHRWRIFVDKQKNIIIVEDEIIIAEDLKITLKNLGYNVTGPFTKGQALIDKIDSLSADLILMDIMLNGPLSGIETAEIIQKNHDIPIIYVTAYANSKILKQVKQTNPFGYIVKPFEERELHATIELAFSRRFVEIEHKRQFTLQRKLLDASLTLSSALDYKAVVTSIIAQTQSLLNCDCAELFTYDEYENTYLSMSESENLCDSDNAFLLIESTMNAGKIITGTGDDPSINYISIPLKVDEKILAILIASRSDLPYDSSEITLINTFANHANMVLNNANIMSELNSEIQIRKTAQAEIKKQLAFEQTISEISSQFVLGHDLNNSIEFTLQNISRRVEADKTYLIQIAKQKNDLQMSHDNTGIVVDNTNKIAFLPNLDLKYFDNWIIQASLGNIIETSRSDDQDPSDEQILDYFSTEQLFAFPVKLKGAISGFVVACFKQIGKEWNERNNHLMLIASDILGNALENSHIEQEKKLIQDQLYQSQKMEVVGKLAGGIAHDFNNLLTAINGYSEIALKKIKKDEPVETDLEVILDCGMKAARLTEKLLGFSRKQIAIPIVLNLNKIILELNKMLARLIPKEIEFVQNLSDEPCVIKADPSQIEQIIVNLVVNACDAMNNKGKLTILTDTISFKKEIPILFSTITPGDYAVLQVTDTGSGITKEILNHIFEPFFTTKKVNEGTGLGLSTVFGIINQNNGFIDVESEVDRGTTFSIYLPESTDDNSSINDSLTIKEDYQLPEGTEKILLIEDEDNIRDFVSSILEDQGYTVISGHNGEAGLEIAESINYDFDLLIADVRMPKISGPEMAKQLLIHNPKLKILFVSGHDNDELADAELSEFTYHFLQKPFTIASLTQKVRKLIDSKILN